MFALVITVHVIVCVLLILIVLIQQGRGGGLIDTFSSAESIFGTKTNTFLVKSTSVLSIVFFLTCLGLAFLSLQKSKSLIETYKPLAQDMQTTPAVASPEEIKEKAVEAIPQQKTETPSESPVAPQEVTTESQNKQNSTGEVEHTKE